MICYLDSSVVLRKIFGEPGALAEWRKIKKAFSSRLLPMECFRTIDRLRLITCLSPAETTHRLTALRQVLSHLSILPITPRVEERVEQPFLTPLGTLDAVHLATALLWKEVGKEDFLFATHDDQLAMAARAHGFTVIGA